MSPLDIFSWFCTFSDVLSAVFLISECSSLISLLTSFMPVLEVSLFLFFKTVSSFVFKAVSISFCLSDSEVLYLFLIASSSSPLIFEAGVFPVTPFFSRISRITLLCISSSLASSLILNMLYLLFFNHFLYI